jgi:hypothetical protein
MAQNNKGAAVSKPPFTQAASASRLRSRKLRTGTIAQTFFGGLKTAAPWIYRDIRISSFVRYSSFVLRHCVIAWNKGGTMSKSRITRETTVLSV